MLGLCLAKSVKKEPLRLVGFTWVCRCWCKGITKPLKMLLP